MVSTQIPVKPALTTEQQGLTASLPRSLDTRLILLRSIAIIAVLVIHASQISMKTHTEIRLGVWFASIARPAIAMFLFLAGYLYKTENIDRKYLVKKCRRVLFPYLFFSGVAYFYFHNFQAASYVATHLPRIAAELALGMSLGIYYFVFVIIMVYIIGYMIVTVTAFKRHLVTVTLLFLALNLLQAAYLEPFARAIGYFDSREYHIYYYRSPTYWPFFFLLGMNFKRYKLDKLSIENKRLVQLAWLFTFIVHNILYWGKIGNFDGYNSVIGTLYAITTIQLLLTLNIRGSFLTFIDKISYFLYLSHFFVLELALDILERGNIDLPFGVQNIILFVLALFIPILLYLPLKKILKSRSPLILGA